MKFKITKSRLLFLFLIASSSDSVRSSNLEEINVTALRVSSATSGSSSALDEEQLRLINASHIQQALERIPGVSFSQNNGQEYLPAIRSPILTGPGACGSFLIAEDGIPLRPAGFCNVNELFEAHSEQASRIEVLRGPGNALYGSNAMHGVINVISPATLNDSNRLALDVGPYDRQRLRLHMSQENIAAAVTLGHDGGYRDDSGVDQQKLSFKHRAIGQQLSITTGMTAVNLNQETAGYILGKDSFKDSSIARTNSNPEAYRDAKSIRLWSRLETVGEKPEWVITPYLRTSRMEFLQHFLPGTPLEKNGQTSIGVQSAFYRSGENSRLITGLDIEVTKGWLQQSQSNPTQGSAFLQATIPAGTQYDYEVNSIQAAPFVHWQWMPSSALTVSAGLRYELMEYDYDNLMLDGRTADDGTPCGFGGCRYSRPSDSTDSFNNLSPSFSAEYKLSDNLRLSTVLARGYRAPQTVELYRLQRDQEIADLNSEQLDSIEVSIKGNYLRTSYELAAYAMHKDNVIYRDSDFFTVSDGKTEHFGIEFSLRHQLTDDLNLSVSATGAKHQYANHQILSGLDIYGNDVDSAPRYFGSIQLGWQLNEKIYTEADWQSMGHYYTDPENLHEYDGHNVVNFRSRWGLSEKITVNASLLNLFDSRYAKRADYTSFGGDRYFPGEPRSLFLGVNVTW